MAQLFIGRKSLVSDVYGTKSEAEFVNTFLDNITQRGAMDKLITDSAQVEQSKRVQDILRTLIIKHWKSEPHYQHQNFAECQWQNFKHNVQWYAAWRKIPGNIWLLLCQWVSDVMNLTSERSLGWRPPLEVLGIQQRRLPLRVTFHVHLGVSSRLHQCPCRRGHKVTCHQHRPDKLPLVR